MTELINKLKKELLVKSEEAALMPSHFGNLQLSLFKNCMKNGKCTPKKRRYTQDVKEFSLTLYFYSPHAYNYVRGILHLPIPSMLRKSRSQQEVNRKMINLQLKSHTEFIKKYSVLHSRLHCIQACK